MDDLLNRILDCIGPHHGAGKELADYLGISPNVITNWKNGSNRSYRKYVKQIAKKYNVSEDYLLGKTEQKEKAPAEAEASDPLSQVSFALFGKHEELDDEILGELREYARFKLEQKKHKEKK